MYLIIVQGATCAERYKEVAWQRVRASVRGPSNTWLTNIQQR